MLSERVTVRVSHLGNKWNKHGWKQDVILRFYVASHLEFHCVLGNVAASGVQQDPCWINTPHLPLSVSVFSPTRLERSINTCSDGVVFGRVMFYLTTLWVFSCVKGHVSYII